MPTHIVRNSLYTFSSILACRLKPVLDNLLGAEQETYIPGRFISEFTQNTYDLFHSAKQNNLPDIILLVDFEKAFDSISFEFIMTTLELFDFVDKFNIWIIIILGMEEGTSLNAVIVVNGNISKPLEVQRGCRQGDPISGYVFIMAIEILALMLKQSEIKPYKTKEVLAIPLTYMQMI